MHMCDTTHSYMWHDSFICMIRLPHMSVTCLVHIRVMTHSYVWHDIYIYINHFHAQSFYTLKHLHCNTPIAPKCTATHAVTHCNTCCNTLQHVLQHTATRAATHCNTVVSHGCQKSWRSFGGRRIYLRWLVHGYMYVTHINESCHIYEWVMTHTYIYADLFPGICMSHIWMRHVTYMNESCHMYEWGMSHI